MLCVARPSLVDGCSSMCVGCWLCVLYVLVCVRIFGVVLNDVIWWLMVGGCVCWCCC